MKNNKVLVIFIIMIILSSLATAIYASSNNSSEVLADEIEWEVIKQINKARVDAGLTPLSVTSEMMDAAEARVEELTELYSPERPNGKYAYTIMEDHDISYNTFGQCIADSVTDTNTLVTLWLNNIGYGQEIMNIKYTHVGVGSRVEVGKWAMLMSGTCSAYNLNAVYHADKTYPLGTEVEDFDAYLILNCTEHGRSYVPLTSEIVTGYDSNALGTQTLTAFYGDLHVEFEVTLVNEEPSPPPTATTPEPPPPPTSPTPTSPSPTESPSPTTIDYNDVVSGSWYEEAVEYVTAVGLFSGTSANTFSPEINLTRGMFVTVLGRLSEKRGEDISVYSSAFTDLEVGSWYYKYVCWAAEKGIITGYDRNTFGPGDNITREQMAVIFVRYADSTSVKLVAGEAKFTDNSEIDIWANYAVGVANASGLIEGYPDGSFRPKDNATRAQASIIFQRFMVSFL